MTFFMEKLPLNGEKTATKGSQDDELVKLVSLKTTLDD